MTDSDNKSKNTPNRLQGEVDKALQSVAITRRRTEQLHDQWRTHLMRLSYLVGLLAMHQSSQPITQCLHDVKHINAHSTEVNSETIFSGMDVLIMVFNHSSYEIMNLIISLLLFKFTSTRDPPSDFSSWVFVITSFLIAPCLSLYYMNKDKVSCINDEEYFKLLSESESDTTRRQFPVSVIFHIIVMGCYGFMKVSMDQCVLNYEQVVKLKTELDTLGAKRSSKKKSK